ncbi:MAG TPA: hypothetical protein VGO62_19425 [Myxococcota bacterium]
MALHQRAMVIDARVAEVIVGRTRELARSFVDANSTGGEIVQERAYIHRRTLHQIAIDMAMPYSRSL